jgi:hypothetical protein
VLEQTTQLEGAEPIRRKVFRIGHSGTDQDVWKKINRLREETRNEERIAIHHVQCMSVQRLQKMVETVFHGTKTYVIIYTTKQRNEEKEKGGPQDGRKKSNGLRERKSESGDNNRSSCARSLQALERRFAREPSLKETYSSFLTEYEKLGHMSVVPPPSSDQSCWYLPHHAVQQQGPRGTKLRVVFDATRSNTAGCSLNSSLLTGPPLLGDLSLLLLRWRNYRYVFTSDIVKMFRQILVHPDDQDLQRILWNSGEPGSPIDFRLQTVTYGTACAPFLAIRTLRELASLERDNLPLGAASAPSSR